MAEMIRKMFSGGIKAAPNDPSRQRQFVVSTDDIDRDGDVVSQAGWQLQNYRKNPVVLWAHDYSSLPIAKCVSIGVGTAGLSAVAEFALHPMAQQVLDLIDGGFLNATSVGFRPMASEPLATGGQKFTQCELLEFSVVPVPANPQALQVMRAKLAGDWRDVWDKFTTITTRSGFKKQSVHDHVLMVDHDRDDVDLASIDFAGAMAMLKAEQRMAKRPGSPMFGDFFAPVRDDIDLPMTLAELRFVVQQSFKLAAAQAVEDAVKHELRRRGGRLD